MASSEQAPPNGDSLRNLSAYISWTRAAACSGHDAVAGEQRSMERFGESEVGGVIRREIVTHLPDAREQNEMGIASERKIEEIGESFGGAFSGDAG